MKPYLTDSQLAQLVETIRTAEDYSTGEIRIHIDSHTEGNNAEIAFEVFTKLCRHQTAELNAVLFHINFEQQYLTIIGDEGIHVKVQQQFWDRLHDQLCGRPLFRGAAKSRAGNRPGTEKTFPYYRGQSQ